MRGIGGGRGARQEAEGDSDRQGEGGLVLERSAPARLPPLRRLAIYASILLATSLALFAEPSPVAALRAALRRRRRRLALAAAAVR